MSEMKKAIQSKLKGNNKAEAKPVQIISPKTTVVNLPDQETNEPDKLTSQPDAEPEVY